MWAIRLGNEQLQQIMAAKSGIVCTDESLEIRSLSFGNVLIEIIPEKESRAALVEDGIMGGVTSLEVVRGEQVDLPAKIIQLLSTPLSLQDLLQKIGCSEDLLRRNLEKMTIDRQIELQNDLYLLPDKRPSDVEKEVNKKRKLEPELVFEKKYKEYISLHDELKGPKCKSIISAFAELRRRLMAAEPGSPEESRLIREIPETYNKSNAQEISKIIQRFRELHTELNFLRKKIVLS